FFVSFSALVLAGCFPSAGSSSGIAIWPDISPQPVRVGTATISLRITDAAGQAVTGAQVKLEGNMSHAGMGPASADAKELEPGRYQGSLELSMAGDWTILVHLTLADGQKLERQFEIKGVRPD